MKAFALALLVVIAAITPLHAQDDEDDTPSLEDTPHITIVGTASTEVAPDLAIVTLGVRSHKPQAIAATDAVAVAAQSVIDAAKATGVAPADRTTQSVALNQSFQDVRDDKGHVTGTKPSGFDASNIVAIRIRDLAAAGRIAQTMIEKGANSFEGVAFVVEHLEPIQDRLEAEAATHARRQAETIAQAAGAKLGRVLLIVHPDTMPVRRAPKLLRSREAAEPAEMPLEAGTASFSAQVQVTWALEK